MLLWRALTGDAKLLISHFRDEDLLHWNAGQRIFEVLSQAHKHISEFEDQDDFDNAFYKLHRERNQTLLQFANVARAAYLKHDAYGYPLPDRTKGMIFLRQAKIPGHLEDHIMAKTNGSRNFSDLLDAIQILARRPMSQVSSSFPSYYDEWDESTNATEYYDIDNRDDVDNDEYYDEYKEPEDHDNEWIDMSDIPEDVTFEEPELACMLESLQKGKKGSGKGFRRGKKGWSQGESRDVSKAGKGGRPENYKQVRWKLQSDRLNRGWKDQPANVTSKGRGRSQLAQVDDLLARTRCFKCGELGHLAKDCSQNKETTTNSETFFSGMAYINSCNVHPRNRSWSDRCGDNSCAGAGAVRSNCAGFSQCDSAGVSRGDFAGVSRNDSHTCDSRNVFCAVDDSRNEPTMYFDSRNDRYAEVDFQQDGKAFLDVRKDDVTFLDVQTDGVTLPVPCSSSSFSLGSVVVGPRANACSDMKSESDVGTDDSKPEFLAKSAEMKRLVGIAVANGTPIRVAYKDVRRRMRIEARRQKELDEGAEPEVVLDSFLDQVKVLQPQQSGPLKRVLTPSAKAAKHRRARDKKLRETLCWWIANDKVCPHGDRCNFRHTVSETGVSLPSSTPKMRETGVSWPSAAVEQDKNETGVSSPGPSKNPAHPRSSTRDSWNNSWDRFDYPDKWTDVWYYYSDVWTDAWRERDSGFGCQHNDDNLTEAWNKCKSRDEWHASHWKTSSWSSSRCETSEWNDTDECGNDRKEQMRSSHSFFETKSMNKLISSLCRGNDVAMFSGIEVDPGESLADTAAQSGIIDIRPFRKAEEALFHKFGLKPRVIPGDNQAVGIGGRAKVLGKVEMPSGMGGVNGIVKYTVVDSPGVPPLTPVSLLKQVGAVIDLNSNTMDLKKIETTTNLRTLPSGHVAHKLTEFAPNGWKAPTLEQTDLFRVKTDVFRPVTLPGEIKSRSSKQCVGFSSGFVYTARNQSHSISSRHPHDLDLCIDDATSSDLLCDDQLVQRAPGFECSSASGFDVNDNSAMEKRCTDRNGSVAKSCFAVPGSRHASVVADRDGLVATSFLKNRSNRVHSSAGVPSSSRQSVGFNGCVRQEAWRMRRHHELCSLSCVNRSQRSKSQNERKEERSYYNQSKGRTDCRGYSHQRERGRCMSKMRPRTLRLQHKYGTNSAVSWMDSRRNTVYVNQSMPKWSHNSWRAAEYQPYRRWKLSEWFWWFRNTSKTRRWRPKSTSFKRFDSPSSSVGGKSSLGTGTVCSVATSPSTVSAPSISTTVRGDVDDRSLASASRRRQIHWGPVEYGHRNGSDWCVIAQSSTENEPVLTASQVLNEHPFEIKQEDEVPELAAAIRERGIWPHHRSFAVFWSPSSARDRSCEFNVVGRDTLLGGTIKRVKLDNGSYLNVLDDSDLADFIKHHAWFEGDEVALPREDRMYLLGNLTGQTPKKRRVTQSQSDLKVLNATCSFPVETEQHELDPDCNGADEMMTDETPLHNENGDDDETIVQKPLTSSQKKVIQNIHNNCGHPSKEEFLRALRLSRARPEVLQYIRREFECPACAAKGHPPKPRFPAALPRTFRFNETLGLDLFEIESPDNSKIVFCNMVCWGTLYQLCIPVVDKTAETVAKCVAERWIQYFGPPLVIIADQGKEFVGTQFKEFTNANSILLHIIDVRAPWQNGRTERHGDIYKKIFERARWLHSPSSPAALQRLAMECNAAKNRLSNRSGYSPLQRVFGIGHRLPADLTSDDVYAPDPIYDLAATDAGFEESRQIREAAMKAHAEVSIRDRIKESVRARPRTQTILRADDVIMVWKTNPPSKRGRWVGPGVCIGTHRGSVWVNMRGSLWKCSQLQCKLATTEESRGLEIQNQLLDDMKAEFQEFPGRRVYTDVEREGIPPSDAGEQPVAPRGIQEEEDRNSALVPMLSQVSSPPPSLPELDSESHHSLREALQGEHVQVPSDVSSRPDSDCSLRTVLPDVVSREMEENVQNVQVLDSDPSVKPLNEQKQIPDDSTPERQSSNQTRERTLERSDEPPTQRPRLENPASSIRWSRVDDPRQWVPTTAVKDEENMWADLDSEVLWQQQVDDHIWENNGKPACLYQEEWDELFSQTCENITAKVCFCKSEFTGLTATRMTRGDELPRHMIPDSEWPRFLQATVAEWAAILDTSAVTIISPAAARDIRKHLSHRIVPSRHVYREKPGEGVGTVSKAKCRWCVLGHRDPDIRQLERSSPTPQTSSIYTFLFVAAVLQREVTLGDLKSAFMQSDKDVSERSQGHLYASLPPGGIPLADGTWVEEGSLVQLNAAVYGLVNAPSAWRKTIVRGIENLGYRRSCYDPCIFCLMDESGPQGHILIEVDDLATHGNAVHVENMAKLQKTFKFGKWKSIYNSEGDYAGRTVIQDQSYGFHIHQAKFVQERLSPIVIPRGRRSDKKSETTDSEKKQLRAVWGSINWVQRESRPDVSALASLGMGSLNHSTVQDLCDANVAVERLKAEPFLGIKLPHIPLHQVRWATVQDASWANAAEDHSQGAFLVGATSPGLWDNLPSPFALLSHKSHCLKRKCSSTLAAETQIMSEALAEVEWIRGLFEELTNPKFSIVEWSARSRNRGLLIAARSSDAEARFPKVLSIGDAKSLYDHLRTETSGGANDRRTAIDIQIIRASMDAQGAKVRWVDHSGMYADAMTKKNGNVPLLQMLLRTGRICITEESITLEKHKSNPSSRNSSSKTHIDPVVQTAMDIQY